MSKEIKAATALVELAENPIAMGRNEISDTYRRAVDLCGIAHGNGENDDVTDTDSELAAQADAAMDAIKAAYDSR